MPDEFWRKITPWREEKGETLGSEVKERVETVWKTLKPYIRGIYEPYREAIKADIPAAEKAKRIGLHTADLFVPGVWARHWDKMSPVNKAINIGLDLLTLAPVVGAGVRAGVKPLMRGILRRKIKATVKKPAKATKKVEAAFTKIEKALAKQDPKLLKEGGRELKEVGKALPEDSGKALLKRGEFLESNAKTITGLIRETRKAPPAAETKSVLQSQVAALRNELKAAEAALRRARKPERRELLRKTIERRKKQLRTITIEKPKTILQEFIEPGKFLPEAKTIQKALVKAKPKAIVRATEAVAKLKPKIALKLLKTAVAARPRTAPKLLLKLRPRTLQKLVKASPRTFARTLLKAKAKTREKILSKLKPEIRAKVAEVLPKIRPIPKAKPVAKIVPKPKPEAKPVAKIVPKPKPEAKPVAKIVPKPKPEAKPVAKIVPKPKPEAKPVAKIVPKPKPEAKPVAKIVPKPKLKIKPRLPIEIKKVVGRPKRDSKGSIHWKQGLYWISMFPPYQKGPATVIYSRKAPPGARKIKGTPEETIFARGGRVPQLIQLRMGITTADIITGQKIKFRKWR